MTDNEQQNIRDLRIELEKSLNKVLNDFELNNPAFCVYQLDFERKRNAFSRHLHESQSHLTEADIYYEHQYYTYAGIKIR